MTGARTSGVVTVVGALDGGRVNVEPEAILRVLWLTVPTLNAVLVVAVPAISQLPPLICGTTLDRSRVVAPPTRVKGSVAFVHSGVVATERRRCDPAIVTAMGSFRSTLTRTYRAPSSPVILTTSSAVSTVPTVWPPPISSR